MQWSQASLDKYLEILASNNAEDIAGVLYNVVHLNLPIIPCQPTGNAQVISYLEQLVDDRRACKVMRIIPPSYGELRWLVARVLACEYAYLGIKKPITLKDVVQPIQHDDFIKSDSKFLKGMTLNELIQQGFLPTKTEIINPQDWCPRCSKEMVEEQIRQQVHDFESRMSKLWTSRIHEFALIKQDDSPMRYSLYLRHRKEVIEFSEFAEVISELIIRKMLENGVTILEEPPKDIE